ncbi:DNA pol B 2 domain-containing protein, partial [Aphis craccivora]
MVGKVGSLIVSLVKLVSKLTIGSNKLIFIFCWISKTSFLVNNDKSMELSELSGGGGKLKLFSDLYACTTETENNNTNFKFSGDKIDSINVRFVHNLSNYDAHFIVTELGYDSHRIK